MQGETKDRWLDVCAEAAICDEPTRLSELIKEIAVILEEEVLRLEALPPKTHTAA